MKFLRQNIGANYTEGGQFQFSTPDQYGVSVTTNLHDRSFNETNKAAMWNGIAFC
jgi:hypothetical protein